MRHMRSQLMGAAGHRLERNPGQRTARSLHHRVISDGVARALLAVLRNAHEGFVLALFLGEESRNAALRQLRHAGDQRPIDFPRRARAECLGESRRRKARLGDQQAARSVLIEPVHQPRTLAVRVAQNFQHAVEVPRGAGAALHRKPHRLVEHEHIVVFIERDRLEEIGGLLIGLIAHLARFRRIEPQRRNAHGLSGFQSVLRLGALAVDAHLAFSDDALDVGKAQARKPRLEEAIDPHAVFVGRDGDVLHAGRHLRRGRWRQGLPFSVILRCAPRTRREGCGRGAPAVAPRETGPVRLRSSKCQVGSSRLVGSPRSPLRVTVNGGRPGRCPPLSNLAEPDRGGRAPGLPAAPGLPCLR